MSGIPNLIREGVRIDGPKQEAFRLAVIGVTLWISGFMCGVFGSSDTASDWIVFLKTAIYE